MKSRGLIRTERRRERRRQIRRERREMKEKMKMKIAKESESREINSCSQVREISSQMRECAVSDEDEDEDEDEDAVHESECEYSH